MKGVSIYHPQLSYCISQYVEKDPETIVPIITGLVRFWPWTNAAKQVLFLNELEEVLELCRVEQLVQVKWKSNQFFALRFFFPATDSRNTISPSRILPRIRTLSGLYIFLLLCMLILHQ